MGLFDIFRSDSQTDQKQAKAIPENLSPENCPFDLLHEHTPITQDLESINQRVRFFCRHGQQMSVAYAIDFNQLLTDQEIKDIEISVSDFSVGVYTPDDYDVTIRTWGMDYAVFTYESYLEQYDSTIEKLKSQTGKQEVVNTVKQHNHPDTRFSESAAQLTLNFNTFHVKNDIIT